MVRVLLQICEYDRFSRPCVVGDVHFSLADRENVFGSSNTGPGVDIWADVMRNTVRRRERKILIFCIFLVIISLSLYLVARRESAAVANFVELPAVGRTTHRCRSKSQEPGSADKQRKYRWEQLK